MHQAPQPESTRKDRQRVVPFERVVLVLQGGGALGAYQGVFQAIHEALRFFSFLISGTIRLAAAFGGDRNGD